MNEIIINNNNIDMSLLATWIKYNRLKQDLTQNFVAYGICSVSHLSYFENGKRSLDENAIKSIFKKLDLDVNTLPNQMGPLRQNFYNLFHHILALDYESARIIYDQITSQEHLILKSPYIIEYKIYQLIYKVFVSNKSLNELKDTIEPLLKLEATLNDELKHILYFLVSKLFYKYDLPSKGIKYLRLAEKIKRTPYTDYHLGFMYGFENQPLKGVYHLEKALKSYETTGYYINAMWCNNYLGIFTNRLGDHNRAIKHFNSALNAAQFFNIDQIKHHVYMNLSHVYLDKNPLRALDFCNNALALDFDPILAVINKVQALKKLNKFYDIKVIFEKYLIDSYNTSRYYLLLRYYFLLYNHHEEQIFETETKSIILPYYEDLHYIEVIRTLSLGLIEYYEVKHKYKKANLLYKKLNQ